MADHDGHTINVGPRTLRWCTTHDDVAVVYADGSVSCRWELVMETSTDDHHLTELPEVDRLRAALTVTLRAALAALEADR